MNRRLLLASIAMLSATRAMAQSMHPLAPAPSATTDSQQKHIKETLAIGSLSLLLSRIALPRVTQPMLKQFARFEIAEQETVADVLKAIQTNAKPKGAIQAPTDAELMQNLDAAAKGSVAKLRAEHPGSQFDVDYIRYEVEGHRKLLDVQEVYLKAPDNLDETNFAKLARAMIKEHLALLADMHKAGG